jgi:hypothetical protein
MWKNERQAGETTGNYKNRPAAVGFVTQALCTCSTESFED